MFSLWIYDIETATRERWNEEAIDANMNDLSAAIERTDVASRIDNSSYAERAIGEPRSRRIAIYVGINGYIIDSLR